MSANGSTQVDTTEEALAAGLIGVDASRRVGWAKAFERARRVDALEGQVATLEEDIDLLRKAYVRLFGFAANLPGDKTDIFEEEIARHRLVVQSFFKVGAYKDGRRSAHQHRYVLEEWDEIDHARRRASYEAQKEAEAELTDECRRRGHEPRFDVSKDGEHYRCSCTCGLLEEVPNEKAAWGWVWRHRVDIVWNGDKAAYRRQRKKRGDAAKKAVEEAETHSLEKRKRLDGDGEEVAVIVQAAPSPGGELSGGGTA